MLRLKPIEVGDPRPIRDMVYELLRNEIIEGRLVSGDHLVESLIAGQLGVSRTPVREALRMLVKDGFAVTVPRKGTVIAPLSRDDAIDIYDLREVVEGLCARRAAANVTARELKQLRVRLERMSPRSADHKSYMKAHAEFNDIIIGASRSHRIAQFLDTLSGQIQRLRGITLAAKERQEESWEEHKAIIDALAARDAVAAENLVRRHIQNAKCAFLERWR